MAQEESGEPPQIFAVKTTVGCEREVAQALAKKATREHVEVSCVLSPDPMRGYVFIEGAAFDRLTNLAASVPHSRGVVRGRPARGMTAAEVSGVPFDQVAHLLHPTAAQETAKAGKAILEDLEWEQPLSRADTKESRARPAGAKRKTRRQEAPSVPPDAQTSKPAGGAPGLSRQAGRAINLAIILPLALLGLGMLIAPSIFWDRFLYPYFWASIDADARNVGGAAEAYNIVDTLTYALILVPALLFIWRVLDRLKIRVDARFVAMLTPFIVLGGAARALEDALYFRPPLNYAFISPLIYVAEGLLVLALVAASWWVVREVASGGRAWGAIAWSAAFLPGALALLYFHAVETQYLAAPIPLPIVLAALALAFLAGLHLFEQTKTPEVHAYVAIAGLLLLLLTTYLVSRWIVLRGWFPDPARPATTHVIDVPAIVALAAAAAFLTLLLFRNRSIRWTGGFAVGLTVLGASAFILQAPTVAAYGALGSGLVLAAIAILLPEGGALTKLVSPINAVVLFGQYLDGAATFWGIDYYGYAEKHVLTGFAVEAAGTAVVMFPLKFAMATFVLYMIDVVFEKDLKGADGKPSSFVGLLKLTVLAVGMGPGTRDALRLAMGV